MKAALLAFVLTACTPSTAPLVQQDWPPDLWGYNYPTECRRNLEGISLPVYFTTRDKLREIGPQLNPVGLIGLCLHCNWPVGASIFIADDLSAVEKRAAIHHERCHRAAFLAGHSVDWHK